MRKSRLLCVLVLCLCAAMLPATVFAQESGETMVIITGGLRGDIDVLPLVAAARTYLEAQGADVIVADAGNFLQGTRYSAFNSGSTMITLMIAAGYDVVALGLYDFAFGTGTLGRPFHGDAVDFGPLGEILEANPALRAVSANVIGENEFFHSFSPYAVIETASGFRVGFLGITDPAAADYLLEANLQGLRFGDIAETVASPDPKPDALLTLSNADRNMPDGTDAWVIAFDNATGEIIREDNLDLTEFSPDEEMYAKVAEFREVVHAELPLIGTSAVTLDGRLASNRGGETALGNFWADALRWFAVSGEINYFFDEDDIAAGNDRIFVPDEYVVALWNAGNLRDFIYPGDITLHDLRRVLPFPNTVAVVYLTGAELLEQLEASAQGLPFSFERLLLAASFMHVSGIEYAIDVTRAFDAGENFRDRVWYTAASVRRVTITSVNGRPFDENAIYAVITSNANFNGMDISYVLYARENDTENRSTITTARVVEHAVAGYIASLPDATITAAHAATDGRINAPRFVPLRETAEALGATVRWVRAESTVIVETADSEILTVVSPLVVRGRAFVPEGFFHENF